MIVWIAMAFAGGVFVSLSRQINGRLSLSNSPLIASFWNHIVGFTVLTVIGLIVGGLIPPGAADAPWLAFIGGPIGVVFIASKLAHSSHRRGQYRPSRHQRPNGIGRRA